MPKVVVKNVFMNQTRDNMLPHWEALVSYGEFDVTIPLPARYLTGDTGHEQRMDSLDAMERLGEALVLYAKETREVWTKP